LGEKLRPTIKMSTKKQKRRKRKTATKKQKEEHKKTASGEDKSVLGAGKNKKTGTDIKYVKGWSWTDKSQRKKSVRSEKTCVANGGFFGEVLERKCKEVCQRGKKTGAAR